MVYIGISLYLISLIMALKLYIVKREFYKIKQNKHKHASFNLDCQISKMIQIIFYFWI